MKKTPKKTLHGLKPLIELMETLRGPLGCPWDRAQTLKTICPFIVEEAYEVVSAIESDSPDSLKEELGDLLFQIIFCCQMAKEEKKFDIYGVIDGAVEKMRRRHPHVFGDKKADTPEEVLRHWAQIKEQEKKAKNIRHGILSDVPENMPALLRAHKISKKASRAGFDWKDISEVIKKVEEEINEFKDALRRKDARNIEEEFGDILFSLVNAARFVEVNPEEALRKTIGKFINRFHYIEKKLLEKGSDLSETTIDEMERLWQEAKLPAQ
ncbi:MAG: nucleoside triphosphate pyrophosphohydrolase [Deltaproteobacteria bacterium]